MTAPAPAKSVPVCKCDNAPDRKVPAGFFAVSPCCQIHFGGSAVRERPVSE